MFELNCTYEKSTLICLSTYSNFLSDFVHFTKGLYIIFKKCNNLFTRCEYFKLNLGLTILMYFRYSHSNMALSILSLYSFGKTLYLISFYVDITRIIKNIILSVCLILFLKVFVKYSCFFNYFIKT